MEQEKAETTDKTTKKSSEQYVKEVLPIPANTPASKSDIQLQTPALIFQEALHLLTSTTWYNSNVVFTLIHLETQPKELLGTTTPANIEHLYAPVTHLSLENSSRATKNLPTIHSYEKRG